jgi:hypothetical protein
MFVRREFRPRGPADPGRLSKFVFGAARARRVGQVRSFVAAGLGPDFVDVSCPLVTPVFPATSFSPRPGVPPVVLSFRPSYGGSTGFASPGSTVFPPPNSLPSAGSAVDDTMPSSMAPAGLSTGPSSVRVLARTTRLRRPSIALPTCQLNRCP